MQEEPQSPVPGGSAALVEGPESLGPALVPDQA